MLSITGSQAADVISGPLEKHFPVSAGTDHREKENARGAEAEMPVFKEVVTNDEPINVSSIIARRLGAQQRLNANPSDMSAQKVLNDCDLRLKGWSQQNKKPGKFTGERGTRMDKREIAGAIETWVRKDFFYNLQPVTGGIGMQMMQNMGWKQGTPLGKSQEGYVAPIAFDVKVGRSGLASNDEQPTKGGGISNHLPKKRLGAVQNVNGKHPVSALSEMCSQHKLGQPEYSMVFESGQSHSKTFLMKCTVKDVDYQPSVASPNKKHAKAQAAMTALRILGFTQDS